MTEPLVLDVLMWVLIATTVAGLFATAYFWRLSFVDRQSRLARALAQGSTLMNVGAVWLAYLVVRRLLGLAPLEGTVWVSAVAIIALELGLVYVAWVLHRLRTVDDRRNGHG